MPQVEDQQSKLYSQVESWRSRLLDIGNRNPLINTSFNPSRGVIELLQPASESIWQRLICAGEAGGRTLRLPWQRELVPPPKKDAKADDDEASLELEQETETEVKDWNPTLAECRASPKLRPDDLLTSIGDRALDRRIRTLDGYANLSISEQGIHCLFLAFGFIKWYEDAESTKEIRSPLLLVPVAFTRATSDAPWELQEAEDDVVDNLCLRQRFKQDFALELPAIPELEQLEEDGARLAYLAEVRKAISQNERWEVEDRCCIGRFAFPKIAMWQDLGANIQSIASNMICQSIGSQVSDDPQAAFGDPTSVPDAKQLDDHIGPGEIKAILDCDSSQLEAIVAAKKGISFVLDGPPGTGKSQTIANIIADALSVGKRVLFVSEKVAALEVVKRRLDDCGLGDFCLECHSSKANRKAVLEELKWCLEIPAETYPNPNAKLSELRKQRQALNDYVRVLHKPQEPIELSMYELHGHIARLTRKEMLGKSRFQFVDPEKVPRSTLDSWIQLLSLAPQHHQVITRFEHHPWRGCKLTGQTLALRTEICDNFEILADKAEQLARDLRPLEEAALVPAGTTAVQLKSLLSSLESSLTIPEVPSSWFVSPRIIASAVIELDRNQRASTELRQSLSEYIDDVTDAFSQDVVELADLRRFTWLERLTSPLPGNYEECHSVLVSSARALREFEASLGEFERALKELIAEIKLPIKADLPIGAVGKLLSVARLVTAHSPFRPSWFEPDQASQIVARAKEAVSHLQSIEDIEARLGSRIDPRALSGLANEVSDASALRRSWETVQAKLPAGQNLDDSVQSLGLEVDRLCQTDVHLSNLFSTLQWNENFTPTSEEARSIAEALPALLTVGAYNGRWADSALRNQLKRQIESVILDLSEAEELRKSLESKFSHRAFLPSAQQLIEHGKRFSSWWSRLVGGYAKYRTDIADLFKIPVPGTKTLIADIAQIATYHKRMSEVHKVYHEIKDQLLPNMVIDQIDSWQRVIEALKAFDTFVSAAPHVASYMATGMVVFSLRSDDVSLATLSELLQRDSSQVTNELSNSLGLAKMPIQGAVLAVEGLLSAAQHCAEAFRISKGLYREAPEVSVLLADIDEAHLYRDHLKSVEALYAGSVNDLPSNSTALGSAGWNAAIQGVEAADTLAKTFGVAPVLKETLCTPGRVDKSTLLKLIETTEAAFQLVSKTWSERISFVNLTKPGTQPTEPRKRVAAELRDCVAGAAFDLETIANRLSKLLAVLNPGMSVSWERLYDDSKAVDALRAAQAKITECTTILSKHGIEQVSELCADDLHLCTWINEAPAELLNSPLARAIATSPARRAEVTEILNRANGAAEEMAGPVKFFGKLFDPSQDVSTGVVPKDLPLSDLPNFLRRLMTEVESIDEWISFNRWRERMTEAGFAVVVEELIAKRYSADDAVDVVCAKLYQQLFDHFVSCLPLLGDFDGIRHEQIRDQYRSLDEWEIKAAAARVREFQLNRQDRPRIGWLAPMTSELGILKRETEKKRRHMPLRKLFNAVPGVLQRLKPCIMMSPLSVSTYLQSDSLKFDLVIFDEASQVFPWDAIGAIYRGSQLIVAGDEKQLPPTSFFTRADIEAEDEEEDIGDFESILSLCKSVNMPNKRLRWHYRSRREPLIAFSNKHFYDGDLVTFPSVRDAANDAVQLVHVADGLWADRKNLPEARKVAELVVDHYRTKSNKSLGVIAFNVSQQQAIEDAIYDLRRTSPVIDVLLKEAPSEPLFVKNLENVQGDERDVIILSFGYGHNEAGKFIKNFGPVSKPGGERRLNVAVTRAREAVLLVSSVRSSDMDLSESKSLGAQLLKHYLEYAEHGVDTLGRSIAETQGGCESPFEEEVAAALIRHGLSPVPQVGCGGFRIDLALKHPSHPGMYCLGIECDGATYHSSKTARDRDRIRQSILEGLGWRICRIWSTDWIRNPALQIQRVLSAYEQASAVLPDDDSTGTTSIEAEFDDLQPQYVVDATVVSPTYLKIDDVPAQQIVEAASRIVTRVGSVDWSELVSLTSRELGFARTGKKIRERIEAILHDQVRRSKLNRSGDRISISQA